MVVVSCEVGVLAAPWLCMRCSLAQLLLRTHSSYEYSPCPEQLGNVTMGHCDTHARDQHVLPQPQEVTPAVHVAVGLVGSTCRCRATVTAISFAAGSAGADGSADGTSTLGSASGGSGERLLERLRLTLDDGSAEVVAELHPSAVFSLWRASWRELLSGGATGQLPESVLKAAIGSTIGRTLEVLLSPVCEVCAPQPTSVVATGGGGGAWVTPCPHRAQ